MKTPHSISAGTQRAFTLIELLTVIAIIGILAAIIIPTIGAVKRSAAKTQLVSNMRQLGLACRLYLQESKTVQPLAFVRVSDTFNQLDTYTGGKQVTLDLLSSKFWSQMTNSDEGVRAFTVNQFAFTDSPVGSGNLVATNSVEVLKLVRTPALFPGIKGNQSSATSGAFNYGYRNHVNYIYSGVNKTTVSDLPEERGLAPILFWDGSVSVCDFKVSPPLFGAGL